MTCRYIDLKVGRPVTLKQPVSSYFLPKGLQDGSTAIFRGTYYGAATIEQDGKEWVISELCIEREMEVEIEKNRWLPIGHPEVVSALEKQKRMGK